MSLTIFTVVMLVFSLNVLSKSCLPCECHADRQYGGIHADCTGLNLTSVPWTLYEDTTSLLLDGNSFNRLPRKAFQWMKKLKYLDISSNFLQSLDYDVFLGLDNLEYLNLDKNQILSQCDRSFQPQFLAPLRKLKKLSILEQSRDCHRTVWFYIYLGDNFPVSLQELNIDCWKCLFTSKFALLNKLTILSFSSEKVYGHCAILDITQSTFKYFPRLEVLNISHCQVFNIQPEAFLPLNRLKTLDMSFYDVTDDRNFDAFVNATISLQDSTIEVIRFKSFQSEEVKENIFMFLTKTSLRELYVSSSLYALVKSNTFKHLPKTIEVFSFQHFQYSDLEVFDELQNYPSLTKVDLSDMVLPHDYVFTLQQVPGSATTFICNDCRCPYFLGGSLPGKQVVPFVPTVARRKTIRKLIINRNRIEYIQLLMFDWTSVEYLDIGDNSLLAVDPQFFHQNNSVTYLNLAKNRLAKFLENSFQDLFKTLSRLEFIDMSANGISSLPFDIFRFSHNIRVINISNNQLQTVDFRLQDLLRLETLDLSHNKLHEVELSTREILEHLPNVSVLLSGNPIVCGCEELNFLKWVHRNPHKVKDLPSVSCRKFAGQYDRFDDLDRIIGHLKGECKSHVVEISASACIAACVMAALLGVLGYRHRWKLRYVYYVGRRGYRRRYNVHDDNEDAYHYDAFVSYADEDRRFVIDAMIPELEERCGLKLCIHHRDFLPGEVIAANIVNAIQNSRKTLIILSPAFLRSNWCEFEYNMARMEGVSRRQEIVLVVLYEDVPMKDLPKDMAMMLRRNCYIEYNNDVFDDEVFWYNVLESIKINRPVD